MQPYTPSSKIKKTSSGNIHSHLATYQGDIIRNSGTALNKVFLKSILEIKN